MTPPPTVNVLGVEIAVLNLSAAREAVIDMALARSGGYIGITGAHGVIEAQDDPEFRGILNRSLFNTPDGMPLVWMGRYYHRRETIDRVYGPDLMREVVDAGREQGLRHFFYGGKEGVASQLRDRLAVELPGIQVTGTFCPPFRPLNETEEAELLQRVEEADPHIIWIGLSTPKQERFMAAFEDKLPGRLMLGVGAAFDFHAGMIRSTPVFFQKAGLEWLFRLCSEPRRLWPRYSRIVPRFIAGAFLQVSGLRKYPVAPENDSAT
jgi:N-acetylglucosaminyldiphosphoundecaprenol N-acetyl-beta-D-mannosaminyltransferase